MVTVEFGVSGAGRSVLCCCREKGRAHGPDNTKNQVSNAGDSWDIERKSCTTRSVEQRNPKPIAPTNFNSVGTNSQ